MLGQGPLEGFAGLFGRIAFGLLGDRFGAKRVLVTGLLVQAFGALAYVFARDMDKHVPAAAVGLSPLIARKD